MHLFGATSSPSCANFALRKCAEDHKEQFSQEVVEKVLHCFFVDDCLVSVPIEEDPVALYHDLVSICTKGGFQLNKWTSNRHEVLAVMPETSRGHERVGHGLGSATCGKSTRCGMVYSL